MNSIVIFFLVSIPNFSHEQEAICEDQASDCSNYVDHCNDADLGAALATSCRLSCGFCIACDADAKCPLSWICNQNTSECEKDPNFENITLPTTSAESTTVVTNRGCSSGWDYLESTDSCYYFLHTLATYDQADRDCKSRDAIVSSITSVEERNFINDKFKTKPESYWISLRKNSDGEWLWPDGTAPTSEVLNWRFTQPDKCCGLNVTCTLVNYIGNIGYWDDADCGYIWNLFRQGYVCKKDAMDLT